jgi:phytoene dehydrogenase-like protein
MPGAHRVDVAIVGGGHNGLTAAAYLAAAGRSVVVLERRDELGGATVSERPFAGVDARLSRYSYLVSLLPGTIVSDLGLAGQLRLARRSVSSYTPDPRAPGRGLLVDHADDGATRASFAAVTGSAGARDVFAGFYETTAAVARAVFPTLTEPLRSRDEMRHVIGDDAAFGALFERPIGETVSAAFADDVVAGVVLTDALVGTFASAHDDDLRQNRCFLYHVIGGATGDWLVPIGGMGAVAAALEGAARAAGATLTPRAEVLSLAPDDRGVDIRYTDGAAEHELRADHVLVNAAPAELDRLLGRAGTGERPEGAQLKLNLLLRRLPRLRDAAVAPERAFAGTLHINETATQLQRAFDEATAGAIPAVPPCEVYCHTLTDPTILGPSLRADGFHTLTVFGLQMPARLFAQDPDAARDAALAATLRSIDSVLAEPIEDCLAHTPDGAPCLEVRTPVDVERDLRMPGGHIFHRDLQWPFAEHDDEAGTWGVETDHSRVLLCGAGARRGGGVSAIPGHNAAMALLGRG